MMFRAILATILLAAVATGAQAQTGNLDCARAYLMAHQFQGHARGQNQRVAGRTVDYRGLGASLEGFDQIKFNERADSIEKAHAADLSPMLDTIGIAALQQGKDAPLLDESLKAPLQATTAPDRLYAEQRKLFEQVRACNVANNFAPVLGAAPAQAQLVSAFTNRFAQENAAAAKAAADRKDYLAKMTPLDCTTHFGLAAMMAPEAARGPMTQRYNVALRVLAPTERPDVLKQRMQDADTAMAGRLNSKQLSQVAFAEEVNACEKNMGMPLTQFGPAP
jgi:hypothetical protein